MILKPVFVILCAICSVRAVTNDKINVSNNQIPLTTKDAVAPLSKDLKVDATITHTSDPAPEFYRGSPSINVIQEREFDRNRYGPDLSKDKWLSLDRDSLYKNPYIANSLNRYAGITSTPMPSVSSLVSPNSSYRDRYDSYGYNIPTATDYLGSKYGSGSSGYYNGAPYGPPQTVDYNGYGYGSGSYSGYDRYNNYYGSGGSLGSVGSYGQSGYGHTGYGTPSYGGGYYGGHDHHPQYMSKFSKSSILPLAGAALLGVAATLAAHPVLFNLGVGKRKRRSLSTNQMPLKQTADSGAHKLAYRGYRN